jgi:hypothetical protein
MTPDYAAPNGAFDWLGLGFYQDAAPTALGFTIESDVWGRFCYSPLPARTARTERRLTEVTPPARNTRGRLGPPWRYALRRAGEPSFPSVTDALLKAQKGLLREEEVC